MIREKTALSLELSADYQPIQSLPMIKRYVFVYRFTLSNHTNEAWQLREQHWQITDTQTQLLLQEKTEIGSAGQQAWITENTCFQAVSGLQLETPRAYFSGRVTLCNAQGDCQLIDSPTLLLSF